MLLIVLYDRKVMTLNPNKPRHPSVPMYHAHHRLIDPGVHAANQIHKLNGMIAVRKEQEKRPFLSVYIM